jgi:hypothetical protein
MNETGEGLLNSEIANPGYSEDQAMILSHLEVGEIKDVIPLHVQELLKSIGPMKSGQTFQEVDSGKVLITRHDNGITTVVAHKQDGNAKTRHEISELYYLDLEIGKAWDASQLWSVREKSDQNEPHEKPRLKSQEGILSSYFPDGLGGVIFIGKSLASQSIGQWTKDQLQFVQRQAPLHEAAHYHQHSKKANYFKLPLYDIVGGAFINVIMSRFPMIGKITNLTPVVNKYMESKKSEQRAMERNAAAFSLHAIRRLRDQGLDIARGMTNEEVVDTINKMLETYDNTFKYIDGKDFSKTKLT